MKTNYLTERLVRKEFICSIIGHHFTLTKKINEHFSEFECSRCKTQVTNDSRGKKITLDSELKAINETLFYLHLRREFISKFYYHKNSLKS